MKIFKSLPAITSTLFGPRVKEALDRALGHNGDPEDRFVTVADLKEAGLADIIGPPSAPVLIAGPSVSSPEPEVDLTPPPTPTGLTVTAGMTRLIIEWDDPAYTAGGGHDRTLVYGATYSGSGPLPTFGSAVELVQVQGTAVAYPTNTGTQWHIWIKWLSKDGVLSSSPAGGTNGVTATTGKVGTSDLNDLIITSQKIASGAVDAFSKFAGGLEPVSAVSSLPSASGYTGPKVVLLTTDNKLYRYTGSAWTVAVPTTDLTGQVTSSQIVDAAITQAKFASGLEPVSIVSSLPSPSGYAGPKTVLLTTDNKLYRYTGSAWTVAVPTTDLTGQVTTAQITDGAVTTAKIVDAAISTAKFASGIEPVSVVSSLPSASGYTGPKTVLLTTDNKLYRYTGSAWTVAVPTTDLTGQVTTTQITDNAVTTAKVAANAITANEIATDAVTANKILAGSVTTAKLAASAVTANEIAADAVTSAKILAGSVTTAKLAASAVTANEIASDAVTAVKILAGSVTTAKLAAAAVTANEIATDAVTANKILAGSVTTAKLAASAVTANEIAADAVTTNKILAGAVTTAKLAANAVTANEIAAGAVTTNKLFIGPVEGASLSVDPNFADSTAWALLSGSAGSFTTITDGVAGNNVLRSPVGAASVYGNARLIPLDATKTYRVRARVRRDSAANGTLTVAVALQDSSAANITGDGTYWNHQAANAVTANTTFTTYTHTFGAGTSKTFPSTARTMKPVVLLNTGGSAGYMELQDFRIEEVIPGELIVDGAIVASKIAANAVVAGKIATGAIVAGDGVIANAAITNALIANAAVDTAKIADASIVTAKIADANITTAKIADANITGAKIANATITNAKIIDGEITASKIAAGTITTDRLTTNAATVIAADAGVLTLVTINTGTHQQSGDSATLITITGTGTPMTIWCCVKCTLVMSSNPNAVTNVQWQTNLIVDGTEVTGWDAYGISTVSAGTSASMTLPMVYRSSMSAASHTFKVRMRATTTNSAGSAANTGSGTLAFYTNIVVTENKV